MTVRAIIADDEPVARAGLRRMLSAHDWISYVDEAATGTAAVECIDKLQPDLVFLDIEMPGCSGLEVMRRVHHQPFVVFTTAYSQHAVTAFELGAVDYLVKPFDPERLAAALERVRAGLGEPTDLGARDRLAEAMSRGPMSRLFVRQGTRLVPVAVRDVLWFESDGDYVVANTAKHRYLVHVALTRVESRLDPARFVRIHRGTIVNLDHVVAFKRAPNKRMTAELAGGTRLDVSRTYAAGLRGMGS
jgi:two-component system LytT family response regulator